jgi:dolichol-phosphate mannosyltransferase
MKKVFILMPAYNEEFGLEFLLSRLSRVMSGLPYRWEVVVVNDGSKDRTLTVLHSFSGLMNLHVIDFKLNRGVTEVFREGFKYVLSVGRSEDFVITLDSDNTQSPYVIYDILHGLESGSDIVVASRFQNGSQVVGVPAFRNFLSNGVAYLLRYIFPIPNLKDYSTFYRGYSISKILNLTKTRDLDSLISGEGFSSMARFLIKLCYFGQAKVTEVPITLRYDLKEGGSGIRIFKTILGYLRLIGDVKKELAS